MADECVHGAVTPDACHLCRPQPAAVVLGDPHPSRVFRARYDDTCAVCGFDVKVREPVQFIDDRLHHARCTDGS